MSELQYIGLKNNFELAESLNGIIFRYVYFHCIDFIENIWAELIFSQNISDWVVYIALAEIVALLAFRIQKLVFDK
jgi:hypothetical protein